MDFFRKLKFFEREQETMKRDTDSYISNPLKAFSLIKQFTNDSLVIREKFIKSVERFSNQTSSLSPKKGDLEGAVEGLARLQMTYNLKTEDLAVGIIDGDKYNASFTAHDMFVIASELLHSQKFSRSIEYLVEALKKATKQEEFREVSEAEILHTLAEAYQGNGDYEKAVETIDNALKLKPENIQEFIEKKRYLQLKLEEGNIEVPQAPTEFLEVKLTRKVCSGELYRSAAELSKLHCRYQSKSGFSKIAPYKLEEAHLDPLILVFHDIISDNEIEVLKQIATVKLGKSVVFSKEGEMYVASKIRISEVAWFEDNSYELVDKISKRIEDITGLTTKTAEGLQIQKYGIAGFYKSHYDFTGREYTESRSFTTGDRIATFLIYVRWLWKNLPRTV